MTQTAALDSHDASGGAPDAPAPAAPPADAPLDLSALDLAALLCSRVCHDVISPVGAIVNGLEVLEDDADEETRGFALDLIRKSARQASARLQFARLAFGAAGSAGAMIDLGDAEAAARGFVHDEKTRLEWAAPRLLLPKNQVKLLLNLLLIAQTAVPRGGTISVAVDASDPARASFRVEARGVSARVPPHAAALLAGRPEGGGVDAHAVQPFYAGALARAAGLRVHLALDGDGVVITAAP